VRYDLQHTEIMADSRQDIREKNYKDGYHNKAFQSEAIRPEDANTSKGMAALNWEK
jgi:hypothetical protein